MWVHIKFSCLRAFALAGVPSAWDTPPPPPTPTRAGSFLYLDSPRTLLIYTELLNLTIIVLYNCFSYQPMTHNLTVTKTKALGSHYFDAT